MKPILLFFNVLLLGFSNMKLFHLTNNMKKLKISFLSFTIVTLVTLGSYAQTVETILDEKSLCSDIGRRVDDFTDEITLEISIQKHYGNGGVSPIEILKIIDKTKISYYLSLNTYSSYLNVEGTDATILFTDRTKWQRSAKIKTDVGYVNADGTEYRYSAFTALSKADLITFSTKNIEKFRLDIYDEEIIPSEAEKFQIYVKCLLKAK